MGPASPAKRRCGVNQSAMHQAIRYGLVGGCVLAVDFAIYWTTLQIAPPAYLAANAAGKIAGAVLGFALHKRFTFSWRQKDRGPRQLPAASAALRGLVWFRTELRASGMQQMRPRACPAAARDR